MSPISPRRPCTATAPQEIARISTDCTAKPRLESTFLRPAFVKVTNTAPARAANKARGTHIALLSMREYSQLEQKNTSKRRKQFRTLPLLFVLQSVYQQLALAH